MRLQKEFIFIGSTDLDPISVISVKKEQAAQAIKNNVGHKQQRVYRKCFVLFCVYQVDTVHGEARINHLGLSVPVSATRTVIVKLQSRSIQGSFQIVQLAVSRKQDIAFSLLLDLTYLKMGHGTEYMLKVHHVMGLMETKVYGCLRLSLTLLSCRCVVVFD